MGSLPVLFYLGSNHPLPPSALSVCSRMKPLEHLFLLCTWVRLIWFGSALSYKVDGEGLSSWARWCQDLFSPNFGSASSRHWVQTYIAFTCWFIWKARCDCVFNKVPLNPVSVLLKMSATLDSFLKARTVVALSEVARHASALLVSSCCAPSAPFYKINVDASWSKFTLRGYAGVIVRAAEGRFVAAARYPICAPSAIAAEALTLFHGCKWGSDLGYQQVIFESDSSEVISCLTSSDVGNWEAFPTLARVRLLGASFQSCRWS